MARPGIALQMYTVRDVAQKDYLGTLRRVAELGYRAIENGGGSGLAPTVLRQALDGLGLTAASAHVGFDALVADVDRVVANYQTLGARNIAVSSLPSGLRQDEAGYVTAARKLGELGRRARELGSRLSYHNHAFEFECFGDRTGMEILLEETDPADLYWQPDVYWVAHGGEDPAAWLRRYAGRCPTIHLKDRTAGAEPTYAEVGEGTLDFQPIFAASADATWYIVEQDVCARPSLESAGISLKNLRAWGYAD